MKKLIKWFLVLVVVLMIYNTPNKAADMTHRIISAVSTAGDRAGQFVGLL